jgi:hypothetical protein
VVGFFSHIHPERARVARDLGCSRVLPRSAVVQELPSLLKPGAAEGGGVASPEPLWVTVGRLACACSGERPAPSPRPPRPGGRPERAAAADLARRGQALCRPQPFDRRIAPRPSADRRRGRGGRRPGPRGRGGFGHGHDRARPRRPHRADRRPLPDRPQPEQQDGGGGPARGRRAVPPRLRVVRGRRDDQGPAVRGTLRHHRPPFQERRRIPAPETSRGRRAWPKGARCPGDREGPPVARSSWPRWASTSARRK